MVSTSADIYTLRHSMTLNACALVFFGGPRVKNGRESSTGPIAGKSLIDL